MTPNSERKFFNIFSYKLECNFTKLFLSLIALSCYVLFVSEFNFRSTTNVQNYLQNTNEQWRFSRFFKNSSNFISSLANLFNRTGSEYHDDHLSKILNEPQSNTLTLLPMGCNLQERFPSIKGEVKKLLVKRGCEVVPCKQSVPNHPLSLESIFKSRNNVLKEACEVLKPSIIPAKFPVTWFIHLKKIENCLIPKVGSSSWQSTYVRLKKQEMQVNSNSRKVSTITVRHPLERLTSAYRDKFLNGNPISKYDSAWQKRTQSVQSWINRWRSYWLPALISSGRIEPTKLYNHMLRAVKNISMEFNAFFKKYSNINRSSMNSFLTKYAQYTSKNDKLYNEEILNSRKTYTILNYDKSENIILELEQKMIKKTLSLLAYDMHSVSNGLGVRYLSRLFDSQIDTLLNEFKDSTFTFTDFLKHVIWTYDNNLEDQHWNRYSSRCNVCYRTYDYIIHLNNIDDELEFILKNVGYPFPKVFQSTHRVAASLGKKLNSSLQFDLGDYKDVPRNIIDKLNQIFLNDYLIFGYEIP